MVSGYYNSVTGSKICIMQNNEYISIYQFFSSQLFYLGYVHIKIYVQFQTCIILQFTTNYIQFIHFFYQASLRTLFNFQTHKFTVLAFSELCFCLLYHIYIIFNKFTFEYFNLSIKTKLLGPFLR